MNVFEKRRNGILMHPTALSGPHGIGDIGMSAYKFVDDLHDMGQTLWQMLPLGPTDNSNSPYSSISTFAGNHLLISLDLLVQDELLESDFLNKSIRFNSEKVEFDRVIDFKIPILKHVSKNFKSKASLSIQKDFDCFCIENAYWLDQYSIYHALWEENKQSSWINWESKNPIEQLVYETKVIQFIFHSQWDRLHDYCKKRDIRIVGDMPIYVGYNSSDVFFNKKLFQLDDSEKMIFQAGCPPCEYQERGQLWGNPLYDWEQHDKTNFSWWKQRFKKIFKMVDLVRLDHFIGYAKYYRIPNENLSAENGEWLKGPGENLFNTLKTSIDNFNVFCEDLGDVTEDVVGLRRKLCFPGMHVLQFDFEDIQPGKEFPSNSVLCTGTHDNDTLLGWLNSLPFDSSNEKILTKNKLTSYFGCKEEELHWEIINYAISSSSNIVIIPIQDICGENSDARFNTPGTLSTANWSWRIEDDKITKVLKNKISKFVKVHNRINNN